MLVVMIISILPMMGMETGGVVTYLIPIYNSVQAMTGIFGFQANVGMSLLTVVMNLIAAGILTVVLTKMFGSEKVMFSK